jgi:hypothetical protein
MHPWRHPVHQGDYRNVEKIAVDLIALLLHTNLEAWKRLAPGSGRRELYELMISLYDK